MYMYTHDCGLIFVLVSLTTLSVIEVRLQEPSTSQTEEQKQCWC